MNNNLKKGFFWVTLERFSAQAIQFIVSIIVARILDPKDYGLIAIMGILLGLAQVFVDSGFYDALIQKKNKTNLDYSTAFFFNVSIGILFFILIYFVTPFIASFYNQPDLVSVGRVLGLLPFITSFGISIKAHLASDLKFKQLALSGLFSVIISGAISIWMAYSGFGVWAIIAQTLGNYSFVVLFMWLQCKWMPTCSFSVRSFKYLWDFGAKLLLTSVINAVYVNLFSFIIAKRYSAADAGLYNRAQTLSMFPPLTFSTILVKVFYPIQCKIEDEDELVDNYYKSIRLGCFIVFPIMIGIIVLAEPLILVILKEQWKQIVPILQILSLGFMWYPIVLLTNNMLSVKGRTDLSLRAEILKKSAGFIFLFSMLSFNIYVFCFSYPLYVLADIIIIVFYVKKVLNFNVIYLAKQVLSILLVSIIMGLVVYCSALFFKSYLLKLIFGGLIGGVSYLLLSYFLKIKETIYLIKLIKKL